MAVKLVILPQCFAHGWTDEVVQLLLRVAVDVSNGHELGGGAVH